MTDLTFDDFSPWLTKQPENIIEFENWIGNKLYGIEVEENKDWERALEIAKLFKEKPPSGIVKIGEWGTFICPTGPPDVIEVDKIKIPKNSFYILKASKDETKKIKVKLHGKLKIDTKQNFTVDVTGGEVGIIIDTHGR